MALLLATINYFRKIKAFSVNKYSFSLTKELVHPSSREVALFGGFALSLVTYILIEFLVVLLALQIIRGAFFYFLMYLLSVTILITVSFSYFNYAREQTSFQAKLVGITLFFILGLISIIPLIVYWVKGNAESEIYTKVFVVVIPLSTLLISFSLPLLFRLTILKPLSKIVSGVQSVISGDLIAHVDIEINDEIGRLSQNFNKMTQSLRDGMEQLNNMRETIATDFHDQTGNMLSAITRQASLLKARFADQPETQQIIDSIINNSDSLYESSQDFLWHLNHDSDNPNELFNYLTGYGQLYYNQFDIAFSSTGEECRSLKFEPFAALNLIFIFKEAMTNVVKHSGADEVEFKMHCEDQVVSFALMDNGNWKESDKTREHYGLCNMERRCLKNTFGFSLIRQETGTQIIIRVSVKNLNEIL
ncbi:histidine kinase [Mucilaginibacter jinjuensis]|uniref:histidine kinase n=1 Tax=Mucilaginibacter jinjuensis TaxID=1176721 RepID=A0ABY7TAS6_9SPHI|nr:HAMP domain-containing protein [Mucilaginibacter jinjuensis]WCT13303.1 HAMP domain-containing protein [Mucilaginibacter jinjuensis]